MSFITFLRSPTFALYAVSAWILSFLVVSGSQAHNNVSYLILLVPTLISLRFDEVKSFFQNRLAQWLLLVITSLVCSAIIGDGDPLQQIKFGLIVLLFFIAIARLPIIPDQYIYRAAWIFLVLICVYVTGNAFWQYLQGIWTLGMRLNNMHAKLENVIYVTNTMGGMLAIITLLGMQQRKFRDVLIAHALVLFFGLVLLQTRSIIGIWIATILLTYASLYRHHLRNLKIIGTIFFVIIALILAITYILLSTSIGESLLARNVYRPEIWAGYIAETLRCGMIFGCGPEHNFQYISRDGHIMVHPHSIFVTQLYKAGIVGFFPLIMLTMLAVIQGYKAKSWAGWYFIVGALGVCFDGSSLIHSPSQRWLVFHLPLALLIAQQIRQIRMQDIGTVSTHKT